MESKCQMEPGCGNAVVAITETKILNFVIEIHLTFEL